MTTHKIGWLNMPGYKGETWNPIIGCSKISESCKNCYAEKMSGRLANISATSYYGNVTEIEQDKTGNTKFISKWNGNTHLVKSQLEKPSKWKKPRMIFVCSMGDLFHDLVPYWWIMKVYHQIVKNPQHIFIVLTKRPENALRIYKAMINDGAFPSTPWGKQKNLWIGVTAENQQTANERIPILLQIPAPKRFVSIEPMLGPIDLTRIPASAWGKEYKSPEYKGIYLSALYGGKETETPWHLDWVICGGESGPNARPMHPDWVRSLSDQCMVADTPFFFKQWGEWMQRLPDSVAFKEDPQCIKYEHRKVGYGEPLCEDNSANMSRVGRKNAGRKLDGKEYIKFTKTKQP